MKTIYLVMESVDLGGNPVKAFELKSDAELFKFQENSDWRTYKIKQLLELPNYNQTQAETWCNHNGVPFYIEEVEMLG